MTKILFREYYGRTLIVIEGHSGLSETGSDIVCAGISTLAFTLTNSVLDEESHERLKLFRNVIRDGYVCLEFEAFEHAMERISGMVDTVVTGFLMLEEMYPEYVKME